jgi:hypothetical protein
MPPSTSPSVYGASKVHLPKGLTAADPVLWSHPALFMGHPTARRYWAVQVMVGDDPEQLVDLVQHLPLLASDNL